MSGWNLGPLSFGDASAISGPYLLYDTRLWAGGSTLANLGSMGSYYDLTVGLSGAKQWAVSNLTGISLNPWTALGGDPDDAGFTFVYANTANAGVSSNELCECGIILNRLTSSTPNNRFYLEGIADGSPGHGLFQYATTYAQFITGFNYPSVTWSPGSPSVSGSVVIASFDNITNYGAVWCNGTVIAGVGNDGAAGSIPAPTVSDLYIYLGFDDAVTTSGKWATGTYAMGLYRGIPNAADIAHLTAAFS